MKLAYFLAWCGLVVALDGCLRAINARETNQGLPLVHAAAPTCIPPMSHWRFKQRNIA